MAIVITEPRPVLLMVRELGLGGTERQVVETARFLQRDRYRPHVGCFRPNGLRTEELRSAGIPILHLPVYSFKSPAVFSAARTLANYIRRHGIQIVHAFDAPLNVFAVPVAKLAGTPVVISSQRGHRDLTGQGLKKALRITDRLADAVVVNCQWMKQYMVNCENVPESKVRLCHNAIDTEHYQRRPIAHPAAGTTVGTVCALRPEKGVDTLIRAFAALPGDGTDLLIVGSGPEEASLRALCSQLGVASRCRFEPATTDVAEWLSQIDIFVLPSRFEALSNSLLEAMAAACCPVASRVGGNPELIEDGKTGLLFTVDDWTELAGQLQQLVQDEARRRTLAAAASAKITSQFTTERFISEINTIYESLLERAAEKLRSA